MRVTQVTVRQNRNRRSQYEHEHLELTIELNEGDKVEDAVNRGRATLKKLFGETLAPDTIESMKAQIAEAEAEGL